MKQNTNQIKCPNCGEKIDVNEILYHQLESELNKDLEIQKKKIQAEKKAFEKQKIEYDKKLSEDVQRAVKESESKLKQAIKEKLENENADRFKSMQDELNEKTEQVKEVNKTRIEIEKLKRKLDEQKDEIELKSQQKFTENIKLEKKKIQKLVESEYQLKLAEQEKIISQTNEKLREAQKKAEQGSMQLQGEVQEIAIEEWLAEQFPLDTIVEIKKGEKGADCLQTVNTRTRQNCGTIYYESKRTKAFQPSWIEKFKSDIQNKNADIGVIVTEAMPGDLERMAMQDGVWICSFDEFKGLCVVLRQSIIEISNALVTQENKGDKMGMLYDFLTSNEFRLQIEAIVEGFTQMKTDLESEKRSMQGIWKKREKQIDKVLQNTTGMYGSIKGIAGNAVQSVALLELPKDDAQI